MYILERGAFLLHLFLDLKYDIIFILNILIYVEKVSYSTSGVVTVMPSSANTSLATVKAFKTLGNPV